MWNLTQIRLTWMGIVAYCWYLTLRHYLCRKKELTTEGPIVNSATKQRDPSLTLYKLMQWSPWTCFTMVENLQRGDRSHLILHSWWWSTSSLVDAIGRWQQRQCDKDHFMYYVTAALHAARQVASVASKHTEDLIAGGLQLLYSHHHGLLWEDLVWQLGISTSCLVAPHNYLYYVTHRMHM